LKAQAISLENSISKDIAEIATLKKRLADADDFIKSKVTLIKEKKAAAATAKALAAKNKATKLAQEKAAAREKALQIARRTVENAKKDVTLSEIVSGDGCDHYLSNSTHTS
jgi:prephenate dehydratase